MGGGLQSRIGRGGGNDSSIAWLCCSSNCCGNFPKVCLPAALLDYAAAATTAILPHGLLASSIACLCCSSNYRDTSPWTASQQYCLPMLQQQLPWYFPKVCYQQHCLPKLQQQLLCNFSKVCFPAVLLAYAAAGEPATASHISSCQKLAAAEKAADLPPVAAAACMRFWRTLPRKHYARNIRVNAAGCKLAAGGNPCLFCCGFLSSKGKKCLLGW